MSLSDLILTLIYTFIFGSMFLGIALGFSIITGVLRIFNLAYPILFLIPAYGTWMFWKDLGLPFIPSIVLSLVLAVISTFLVYRFVVCRFMEAEDYLLAALILVFLIVEEVIKLVYPEAAGVYLPTIVLPGTVKIGPATVAWQFIITAIVSIVMTVLYIVFFIKTKRGLIMRAVSQDYFTSRIMGINFNAMFALAMIIGSIPPGIIMFLITPVWALNPYVGWVLFTYGIMVAVLGGLGNLKGTIIAAYVIGFISSFTGFLINPRLMSLSCLIVVIIILALKPRGLARAETIW
ncbi:MAG: branched-chain amino acid ABC transporter permease [Candidatus Nezhaarchaeota archaeon]|nr:branched-chain amino acid ABC transporter permease [Candidatus Nezhaarchaeota archaeon]